MLLSYILNKPREHLLTYGEDEVNPEQEKQFTDLISERAKHKPVAYLVRNKEFYGRDFYVDERVHIPRPATEDMIDFMKSKIPNNFSGAMADIGTGSGCIAVTLALEFPQAKIIATDISPNALAVAKRNAKTSGVNIDFYNNDLLTALPGPVDILVSNPPYGWPEGWTSDEETKYQPQISYESGADGLDAIKQIINQLPGYLNKGGQAFIEFDPRQRLLIENLLKNSNFKGQIRQDLSGFDRILHLRYV